MAMLLLLLLLLMVVVRWSLLTGNVRSVEDVVCAVLYHAAHNRADIASRRGLMLRLLLSHCDCWVLPL